MKLWGLTGGIASGKSLVHRMFVRCGAHVVDADAVYHGLIAPQNGAPSPLTQKISRAFDHVVMPDGTLNRQALGAVVFADPIARRQLERITHPQVQRSVQTQLAHWAKDGVAHAIYDVPLLFERAMQKQFDGIIVVWVPHAVQLERLKLRDNLSDVAAAARLAAQLPLDDKRNEATWCIDNSTTQARTEAQVHTIWKALHTSPEP